jgi:hypothetical protein
MYRQQFLDYLERYDYVGPKDTPLVSSAPQIQSTDSEWFRKPSTLYQQRSSSFSTFSQSSTSVDLIEDRSSQTHHEGEDYLSTPCVKQVKGFQILEWWSKNESFYPHLAKVAKDILAIPITQVGVERVFNIARDVLGDRRHRLSAQAFREIMIFKDTISQEGPEEEDILPYDEVDDLFELPACEGPVNGTEVEGEEEGDLNSADEEPLTPLRREPRPRKRARPSRYQDDIL